MSSTVINIARNAVRPGWGREMLRKLWLRWSERDMPRARDISAAWCRERQTDAADWARALDPDLWRAAETFAAEQQEAAGRKLAELGVRMGGGGFYALLYFLTRLVRPETVVETGVAAGFSSRAFLRALAENGGGRLISSDFPYFRLEDPERFVGCLVEPDLRARWTLMIGSDRDNLPKIAAAEPRIDLLHYDSDKSHAGRELALRTLRPRLHDTSLILFDDIQDNLHFRNWTEAESGEFRVFEFMGKWIGMRGGPASLYRK